MTERSSLLRLGEQLSRLNKKQRRRLRRERVVTARTEKRAVKLYNRVTRAKQREEAA